MPGNEVTVAVCTKISLVIHFPPPSPKSELTRSLQLLDSNVNVNYQTCCRNVSATFCFVAKVIIVAT